MYVIRPLTDAKEGWTDSRPQTMQASLLKKSHIVSYLMAAVLMLTVGAAAVYAEQDTDDADGYLGVYMQKLTRDIARGLDLDVKRGVLISGVADGSPADKAGIEDGDVIIEFDGHKVNSPEDLRDLVEDTDVGKNVEITLIRDGDKKTIDIIVGERPEEFAWTFRGDDGIFLDLKDGLQGVFTGFMPGPRLGVKATGMNDDLASYFDTDKDGGVLVLEVEDESVAEAAGVKAGDVIQEVDGEDVSSVDELRESLEGFEEGDGFDVVVIRHGKKKTLKATMDDQNHFKVIRGGDFHFDKWNLPHRYKVRKFDGGDRLYIHKDDVKDELEELKEELEELKKELKRELKKLKKD